jgi:hypothetical protein
LYFNKLEIAQKEDLTVLPKFKGFLKNEGKILNIDCGAEVVFTTDLIYTRYALALAFLKSAKQDCSLVRKSVGDLSSVREVTKKIRDKLLFATLRVFRLRRAEPFVFYGLYDSIRIFELNHNTLHALDQLMRLNFASVLLLLSFSDSLTPDKLTFALPICQRTLLAISELKRFFATPFTKQIAALIDFLDIAEFFFRCLAYYLVLKMTQNMVLAKEIKNLLQMLKTKVYKTQDVFNIEENKRFVLDFFLKFGVVEMDELLYKSY